MTRAELAIIIRAQDMAARVLRDAGKNLDNLEKRARHASRQIDDLGKSVGRLGKALTIGITLPAVAVGGALGVMAAQAVESENLFSVSMGAMEDAARQFSERMRDDLGLNSYEVRRYVGTLNVMTKSMGLSEDAAYRMSTSLTRLTYDISSFYNISQDAALDKVTSGLVGMSRPLQDLGILVNETTIKQWALNNALIESGQELSEQQKVLARYAVIMEQTTAAQGDLARTIESPINQWRRMQNQIRETAIEVGERFLPVVAEAFIWINNRGIPAVRGALAKFEASWTDMSETAQRKVLLVAGLLVAGGPLLTALGFAIRGVGLLGVAFMRLPGVARTAVLAVAAELVALRALWDSAASMSYETYEQAQHLQGAMPGDRETFEKGRAHARSWVDWLDRTVADIATKGTDAVADAVTDSMFDSLANQLHGLTADLEDWAYATETAVDRSIRLEQEANRMWTRFGEQFREAAEALTLDDIRAMWKGLGNAAADAAGGNKELADSARTLRQMLAAAGISVSEFVQYLVSVHPAAVAAAQTVETLRLRLTGLRDQLDANGEAMRSAQARLSELNEHMARLQQRWSELTSPKLRGMGEMDRQIAWVNRQMQRLQYARRTGMGMDEVMDLFPAMSEAEREFIAQLPQGRRALERYLETLQLGKGLQFDEALRLIAEEADAARQEMDWQNVIAQMRSTRGEMDAVSSTINAQHEYVRQLEQAGQALNQQIAQLQRELADAERYQKSVNDALSTAYDWFLRDREAIEDLGDEAVAQAAVVDDAARTLLASFTGMVNSEVATTSAAIDALVAKYNEARGQLGAAVVGVAGGGEHRGYARGGWITEPVFGVGLKSGASYSLAERGPEYVSPGGAGIDYERLAEAMAAALGDRPLIGHVEVRGPQDVESLAYAVAQRMQRRR